jgi:DNA-binding beta-propeller fold protein YncE
MTRYGSDKLQYEVVPDWAKVPEGWSFVDIGGIAVDGDDNVYVLSRSEFPVQVFDRDGNILRHWGEGFFKRAHGARIAPDGSIFCTDDGDHFVAKFSPTGELLMTLGRRGVPSDTGYRHTWDVFQSTSTIDHAGPPFNRPTGIALTPNGDIFISDGYGNCRIHHFDASGTLLHSWGEVGGEPGHFRLPHDIALDHRGRLLVPDRENSRIQLFSQAGALLGIWHDVIRPTGIGIDKDGLIYVSELCLRVSVFDEDGKLVTRWGNDSSVRDEALFLAPHTVAVDSHGDVYVGDVLKTHAGTDRGANTIHKFRRLPG